MSDLETSVGAAGYEIVSWQTLKHPTETAISRARAEGVDVVFEVNQLSVNDQRTGASEQLQLVFAEQVSALDSVPVLVPKTTQDRCRSLAEATWGHGVAQRSDPSATLDVKAVRVSDGVAFWRYTRTLFATTAKRDQQTTLVFAAPSTRVPRDPYSEVQVAGVVLTGVGPAAAAGGIGLFASAGFERDQKTAGTALMIGGALATAAGIATLLIGNSEMEDYNSHFSGDYVPTTSSPEAVLCVTSPVPNPFSVQSDTPESKAVNDPGSSSVTFETSSATAVDMTARLERTLLNRLVQDFVAELSAQQRETKQAQ